MLRMNERKKRERLSTYSDEKMGRGTDERAKLSLLHKLAESLHNLFTQVFYVSHPWLNTIFTQYPHSPINKTANEI